MKSSIRCRFDGCDRQARTVRSSLCGVHYTLICRRHQKEHGLCALALCPQQRLGDSQYCQKHKHQRLIYRKSLSGKITPEFRTVSRHLHLIRHKVSTYAGMPFFDGWNPNCGGAIKNGEAWIVKHLGNRPAAGYDMHVVDRQIGFMPGNLQWVPRDKHRRTELLNTLLREIQQLKLRLAAIES